MSEEDNQHQEAEAEAATEQGGKQVAMLENHL